MKIQVRLNGELQSTEQCSVAECIAAKGLSTKGLVVELNGRIIRQPEWTETELADGDILELLNFVGGG